MLAKRITITPLLVVLCTIALCGCTKQNLCGDSDYDFSWNDYNSVKAVECFFNQNLDSVRMHEKDTILVKGYLNENIARIEESWPPCIYLSDKPVGFLEDTEHKTIKMVIETFHPITVGYRNKLLYIKGTPFWEAADDGFFFILMVNKGNIDTIMIK